VHVASNMLVLRRAPVWPGGVLYLPSLPLLTGMGFIYYWVLKHVLLPRKILKTSDGSQDATNATTMAISMRFVFERRFKAKRLCSVICRLVRSLSRFCNIP
jgi:hypothetical protein